MGMRALFSLLLRLFILIVGAVIGVGLFLFAVVAFIVILIGSLLMGRRPVMQFRMNRNPWARHRAPASSADDIVDIEAREVRDPEPLPLQPPRQ